MGKQLSILGPDPSPAVDRVRTALPRTPPKPLPVGRVFPALREFVPSLPVVSKRIKVPIVRIMRDGDRPQSLGAGPLTRWERKRLGDDEEILKDEGIKFDFLPETFGDCPEGPCPRYRCRHHVGIEADGDMFKNNFPHKDFDELKETCTLRVANEAGKRKDSPALLEGAVMSCDEVGEILNLSPERIRQVEGEALAKMRRRLRRYGFREVDSNESNDDDISDGE
jgi:hypothetical protein